MHKTRHGYTILIFILVFVTLGVVAYGQTPTAATTTIEINLACFVANQYVHKYYPEFQWRAVDHVVLHDIDGAVRAYAFIFAKPDTAFRSPADLQRHILEKSASLREAQEKAANAPPETQIAGVTPDSVVKAEEALYNFSNLATVITGATRDSKLILRHFRGIPEFWVNAEMLDPPTSLRLYGKELQVFRIIMITPMDFRLAASEGTVQVTPGLRTVAKAALSDSAQCIKVSAKKVESIATVRKERQAIKDRKQRRFNTLEPTERARYEQALQDRAKAMADKWQQYREMQINIQENE